MQCPNEYNESPLLFGSPIEVNQADAPSDIIWEHKEIRHWVFFKRLSMFMIIMGIVFYLCFVKVIYPLNF